MDYVKEVESGINKQNAEGRVEDGRRGSEGKTSIQKNRGSSSGRGSSLRMVEQLSEEEKRRTNRVRQRRGEEGGGGGEGRVREEPAKWTSLVGG